MKRGTPRHPKMKALARRLKIPLPLAVGVMEMLWHFTGEFTPMGDIGRHSDADIAEAVGWQKDATTLVDALVKERWLDKNNTFRLIVHDWPDHADDAVRKKLHRAKQDFLPMYARVADSVETPSGQSPDTGGPTRAEGQGKARLSKKEVPYTDFLVVAGRELADWVNRLYDRHPKQKNLPLVSTWLEDRLADWEGFAKRASVATREELFLLIDRAHEAECRSIDWKRENGRYAPTLDKWLGDEAYRAFSARASPTVHEPDPPTPKEIWEREVGKENAAKILRGEL